MISTETSRKTKKTNKTQLNSTMWKINFKSNFSSKTTYHILIVLFQTHQGELIFFGDGESRTLQPNKPSSSAHLLASNLTESSEGFDSKMFALVGGWTNPIEKYSLVKMGNLPQVGVEINKYLSCHHLFLSFTHLVFLKKHRRLFWDGFYLQ